MASNWSRGCAGYKVGQCVPITSEGEDPALAFVMTRCFVDASGDFVQYEQERYDDAKCLGSLLESVNTSAPGCLSADYVTQYRCDDSSPSPWRDLPPAVHAL